MVALDHRPKRRPGLALAQDGNSIYLYDTQRVGGPPLKLSSLEIDALQCFTGTLTLAEIQLQLMARGDNVTREHLQQLVRKLDEALFLESPALHNYLRGPIRRPSCIGCYPEQPQAIQSTLRSLFVKSGGPGLPEPSRVSKPSRRLRALLVPHMDYERGGVTYGWGFKQLAEQTDARLFVIIGTSHYSPERFSLTRMNFSTPLGVVPTDLAYIDRLVENYGDGLFDDPYAHLPEHSIELEVVLLQHLFPGEGAFRIVPLLVGSFHDTIISGRAPQHERDISRMIKALRQAEAAAGEPVCYIISGDLAHIGPKFRDPTPVSATQLRKSREQDDQLLAALEKVDSEKYWDTIREESDSRRICGLPPTYLTLHAAQPRSGKTLHYGRYVHPTGHESVSFAAAAFYD